MAKYRTLKQFLYQPPKVDGVPQKPILYARGVEIEFEGRPSETNLEPLDAEARAAIAAAKVHFDEERRVAALNVNAQARAASAALAGVVGDAIAEALAGFVAKSAPKAKPAAAE